MDRCTRCGAQILSGTCHCGFAGRMREASSEDVRDAVAAYDEANSIDYNDPVE